MARSLRLLLLPLVLPLAFAPGAQAAAPTVTIALPTPGQVVPLTELVAGSFTADTGSNVRVEIRLKVDAGAEVAATIVNTGYTGNVTLPSADDHTITATIYVTTGTVLETSTATVTVHGDPPPEFEMLVPIPGFETGDTTVDVSGHVNDDNLDPNNPNKLTANGQVLALDAGQNFSGRIPLAIGSQGVIFRVSDILGNVTTRQVFGTRTTVCQNPSAPTDNTDPNKPHFFPVDRFDDQVLPNFDPNDPNDFNDPNACDIHPDRVPDDPNDGITPFRPPTGKCTLRAALQVANAHPGPDVIRLPGGAVRLTRRGAGEDLGLRGDLDVTDDVVIFGIGRDISSIDARKLGDRVFDVHPGASFTFLATTVRGGQTPKKTSESGGCVRVVGPRNTDPDDPNDPNDMKPSFVSNNLALLDCKSGADGGGIALELQGPDDFSKMTCAIVARSSAKKDGGGILLDGGSLSFRNSTIAFASSGGIGGALANRDGSLTATNATFSGNKAKLAGGGLALASGADASLNNVTFAKNKAKRGMSVSTSTETGGTNDLDVSNSILGDKAKATCDTTGTSPLVSHGGNLDPGATCGVSEASDLENADPKLDKLATNVGIPTHALKADSPAIDHGVFATCEPLDERNADRVDGPPVDSPGPNDDVCDSGAFEFASEAPPEPAPKP